MSTVKGVETNEFSRFVDHTLATPWETFINDLEKAFRSILENKGKVTLRYLEYDFTLTLIPNEKINFIQMIPENFIENLRVFIEEPEYLLLSTNNKNSSPNSNLDPTITSALTIAFKNMGQYNFPVVFVYQSLKNGFHDILVYKTTGKNLTIRSESHGYNKVTRKHPLFFYDGIRKLYQRKLKLLSMDYQSQLYEHFTSIVGHYYEFEKETWFSYLNTILSSKSTSLSTVDRESSGSLSTIFLQTLDKIFQNKLYNLCLLQSIFIKIEYYELKQQSIVDNDSYTTFLPSRQPPSHWKLLPDIQKKYYHKFSSDYDFTHDYLWKESSLRRLFCFYLFSLMMTNNSIEESLVDDIDIKVDLSKEALDDFSYLQNHLSKPTIDIFNTLFPKEPINEASDQFVFNANISINSRQVSKEDNNPSEILENISIDKEEKQEFIYQLLLKCLIAPSTIHSIHSTSNISTIIGSDGLTKWLEILAVLVSLVPMKGLYFIRVWNHCLRELQHHFDIGSISPFVNHLFPMGKSNSSISSDSVANMKQADKEDEINADSLASNHLTDDLLWDDIFNKYSISHSEQKDYLPQTSSSIIIQKLQLIQLSMILKRETSYCSSDNIHNVSFPANTPWKIPTLARRIPITSDVIAIEDRIATKYKNDSSRTLRDNPFLVNSSFWSIVLNDMNSFKFHNPTATFADFAQWYRLEEKLKEKKLFSSIPALNNEDQASHLAIYLHKLQEIWDQAPEGVSAMDQKPLFSAHKEASKAIVYLERLTCSHLTLELLTNGLNFINQSIDDMISNIFEMVGISFDDYQDLSQINSPIKELLDYKKQMTILLEKYQNYRKEKVQAMTFSNKTQVSTPMKPFTSGERGSPFVVELSSSEGPSLPPSPLPNSEGKHFFSDKDIEFFQLMEQIIIIVSNIENIINQIQQFKCIIRTFQETDLHLSPGAINKILSSLFLSQEYTLQTPDEVSILRQLMKGISTSHTGSHNWHSSDGRELGIPCAKEFVLSSFATNHSNVQPNNIIGLSMESNSHSEKLKLSLPEEPSPIHLDFEDPLVQHPSNQIISLNRENQTGEGLPDFRMKSYTDGNFIQVVYNITEKD